MPGPDEVAVRQVADDEVAQGHVLLHDRELVVGQAGRLAQDAVRDADLADVVEQAGDPDRRHEIRLEPEPVTQVDGVAGDVLGVSLRVAVASVDRHDQPLVDVERPGLGRDLEPGAGRPDRVAAAALRLLEGDRRRRQEIGDRARVLRVGADAGADRDRQRFQTPRTGGPDPASAVRRRSIACSRTWTSTDGSMTRNSSGPYRPRIAPVGNSTPSSSARVRIAWSPAAWPWVSLSRRKLSMSSSAIAIGSLAVRAVSTRRGECGHEAAVVRACRSTDRAGSPRPAGRSGG